MGVCGGWKTGRTGRTSISTHPPPPSCVGAGGGGTRLKAGNWVVHCGEVAHAGGYRHPIIREPLNKREQFSNPVYHSMRSSDKARLFAVWMAGTVA